jgi:hypothetical protein
VCVQAPNAADLGRSGTCWQHSLGAGWHAAPCLDPLLFLHMERCQMDRQSESSDSTYCSACPKSGGAVLGAFETFKHKTISHKNYVSYYNTAQNVTLPAAKIKEACSSHTMLFSSFLTNHILNMLTHVNCSL